ncbi:signal peptidase II [Mycoplasma enhydrae]|uniref:signal peptidase II n=1 Tax=Mycoplasma enhydrae TaxID=2499220 RepID=UPI0021E97244|nr:signal peptidase II [Mycoplasma enhydrae]MCV3733832.1 signal peptidase II [Mycoplasma enhydrae]
MEDKKIKYFSKEYWKTNWKTIVINLSVFIGLMFIFSLVDLLTKGFLFRWKDKANLIVDEDFRMGSSFMIIRSVLHKGTTIGIFESNLAILHTISFLIILGSMFGVTFIKDRKAFIVVFLAMISAGSFGNMYDRFAFKGVRDIINLPWANHGVFNIADVWLVLGAIGTFLSILIYNLVIFIKNKKKQKLEAQIQNQENNEDSQFTNSQI